MSSSTQSPANPPATLLLPLVLLLFAASGCAALIYEVVWYQMLQLAIGASAVSLGILLATFMGGLCLGSWFLPKMTGPATHPLRVYALIELGIGLCGLLVLWGLPLIDDVYFASVHGGLAGMLTRGALCAVCLLAPTFLMGASLPAISRFISATPRGVAWWGWLYAGNTLGAVAGCLLAGFYLLRLHDLAFATYVAVTINIAIAIASFALAMVAPATSLTVEEGNAPAIAMTEEDGGPLPVYLVIGLSGAAALGAEVVWTRQLGMLFDGTTYAFSLILAVFLIGLGLGSGLGALALRILRPRLALGWCQILLAAGICWAAFMISQVLPFMPEPRALSGWDVAMINLTRSLMALLPATLLWGASFPLAMAAAKRNGDDPAKPVARVYAANTFGGIVGALVASLVLVAWIGTRDTQRTMLVLVALGGFVLLLPVLTRKGGMAGIGIGGTAAAVLVLAWALPEQPGELVAFGKQIRALSPSAKVLEVQEGMNSSLAVSRVSDGSLQISVAGHVEATNESFDMSLQRMIGHIPALIHPNPVKILGIGFGAGVSAGSFVPYPSVKSITVVEMEPKVPPTSTKYFALYDNNVKNDPRTTIVYDDGRHFMMTTKEKYDVIASDPLDVWVKGTASIYSKDYFEKVKEHLNPGGYFTLYVPLYESDEETVKSEFATFFAVFPHGTVWANLNNGQGYDLVLMGQADPLKIDIDAAEQRLHSPEFGKVRQSMQEIGFSSATDMYATYLGDEPAMRAWMEGAQINTDKDLRLMYLAGWGINSEIADVLYRKILAMRKTPSPIFTGSPQGLAALYRGMQAPQPEEDKE
jgi:spermidine synthase